jgi:hypothetical protein
MSLTKEEIIDYAMQYVTREEITDFPMKGDLFCILQRSLPENRILKDDEGWQFAGYHVCNGYMLDDEARPIGKWVWMQYVSLASFPPQTGTLKLQPPHIVKGMYQDGSRTHEFRMVRLEAGLAAAPAKKPALFKPDAPTQSEQTPAETGRPGNILKFPTRKTKRTPVNDDPEDTPGRSA